MVKRYPCVFDLFNSFYLYRTSSELRVLHWAEGGRPSASTGGSKECVSLHSGVLGRKECPTLTGLATLSYLIASPCPYFGHFLSVRLVGSDGFVVRWVVRFGENCSSVKVESCGCTCPNTSTIAMKCKLPSSIIVHFIPPYSSSHCRHLSFLSAYHSISKAKSVLIGSRGLGEALCQR